LDIPSYNTRVECNMHLTNLISVPTPCSCTSHWKWVMEV